MSGTESQKTGDHAQRLVLAALGRDITGGVITPDLGEDIWVEYEGIQAAKDGSPPLRAFIQARGTDTEGGDVLTRNVELKHVRRWAAQPLPIFVVGVATRAPTPTFYAKSIDSILRDELANKDPMRLTQETIQVHLPAVPDLPTVLRTEIKAHYHGAQLVLEGLDENTIEHDHFEILDKGSSWPLPSWKVLWKSSPRPQHLLAVLREIARRAQLEHAEIGFAPPRTFFHLYRSLSDHDRNIAAARIEWTIPSPARATDAIRILDTPGSFHIRQDQDVEETREFFRSHTATPQDFLAFAALVGSAFDQLTDVILANPSPDVWDHTLRDRFKVADELWVRKPFAPTEHLQLNAILEKHHVALLKHNAVSIRRRTELDAATLHRLLDKIADELRSCHRAWRIFGTR